MMSNLVNIRVCRGNATVLSLCSASNSKATNDTRKLIQSLEKFGNNAFVNLCDHATTWNNSKNTIRRHAAGISRSARFVCQSAEGDSEGTVEDDSKFIPIQEATLSTLGPPVMLLVGFKKEEVPEITQMLSDMGGEFVKVSLCSKQMLQYTLAEAVSAVEVTTEPATGLQRVCLLSGLNDEEIMMIIDAWAEVDLKETVFAAMVPNNSNKTVQDLLKEIMGDHERLTGQQAIVEA